MQALPQGVPVFCSVKLSDNDRRAGRKAGKEADNQIDDLCGRASHACQRLFADEMSDDDCVYRIIELLKKCSENNRTAFPVPLSHNLSVYYTLQSMAPLPAAPSILYHERQEDVDRF